MVTLYEPNEKREISFAYCELLEKSAKYHPIDRNKELYNQFILEDPIHAESLEELQNFRDLFITKYNNLVENTVDHSTLEGDRDQIAEDIFRELLQLAQEKMRKRYDHIRR